MALAAARCRLHVVGAMVEDVALARRVVPHEHFVVSVIMTNLGDDVAELGEVAAAIELLEDALARSMAAGRAGEAEVQQRRLASLRQRAEAR